MKTNEHQELEELRGKLRNESCEFADIVLESSSASLAAAVKYCRQVHSMLSHSKGDMVALSHLQNLDNEIRDLEIVEKQLKRSREIIASRFEQIKQISTF